MPSGHISVYQSLSSRPDPHPIHRRRAPERKEGFSVAAKTVNVTAITYRSVSYRLPNSGSPGFAGSVSAGILHENGWPT